MTDQQLRDLLEERVAEVTMPDLSGTAWRAGRRARRRGRLATVGAAAVAMAAVTVGVAVLVDDGRTTQPTPAPGVPTQIPTPSAEPDAAYEGVPVWWSLGQEQEVNLPPVEDAPLPAVIDLESEPNVDGMDHAVAAFSVGDRVRLVDADGGRLDVSLEGLDDLVKPNGYGYRPVHQSMLSPRGDYLVFPQNDGVAVYTVATREWRSIATGDRVTRFVTWVADDAFVLPPRQAGGAGPVYDVTGAQLSDQRSQSFEPPFDVGSAQAFGPTRRHDGSQAQAYGMGVPIPVADAGSYLSEPEFIVASAGGTTSVLAMMWDIRDGGHEGRFLQCCPVAGWLDDRTLVYESRQTAPALVAWTVGTDDFGLVSRIEGQYLLASFARLGAGGGAS
ncbi:hypothetical protein [Nocardioides dilutus]